MVVIGYYVALAFSSPKEALVNYKINGSSVLVVGVVEGQDKKQLSARKRRLCTMLTPLQDS